MDTLTAIRIFVFIIIIGLVILAFTKLVDFLWQLITVAVVIVLIYLAYRFYTTGVIGF